MAYDDRYENSFTGTTDRPRYNRGRKSIFGSTGSPYGGDWAYRDRDRTDDDRWGRQDRGYGRDSYRDDLPRDETTHLIASNKVEGTAVYGQDGERLGHIYNFMVDKMSGRVEYAVMAYGGFLRIGERYFPIPWRMLTYDTRRGGYRTNMTEDDLEHAPSFGRDNEPSFSRRYGRRVYGYYGLTY
jgi:hypothetical protein